MTTMLNKAAEAARRAQEIDGGGYCVSSEINWPVSVLAVLRAIREPSRKAIQAGAAAGFEQQLKERKAMAEMKERFGGLPAFESAVPLELWQEILDHIIAEQEA